MFTDEPWLSPYMLFVRRCAIACRSCSTLKSSSVKFNRAMCNNIKSSVNIFGGGDRSTSSVSHRPLQVLRTLGGPKLAPNMTNATLKITLMPSQRKQSQIRSNVSHGSVRVIAQRNQSVIYSNGSTLCFSR